MIELSEPLSKRLQRPVQDARYSLLGLVSRWLVPDLIEREFDRLSVFCCFVGHGRSGGSLVGALLNAHPNVVMSNELNALRRLRLGMPTRQLFRLIYLVSKRQVERGSIGGGGYSYAVPNQWQGKHRELMVIGDRKAGATAYEIVRYPALLDTLDRKVGPRKLFIHVVRNPFDTIATTYLKTLPTPGTNANAHLSREISNFFARCSAVEQIETRLGAGSIYYLHHEHLIADPANQIRHICKYLGIEAFPDYLLDCAGILKKSPHKSRRLLEWPALSVADVKHGISKYHWLSDYKAAP